MIIAITKYYHLRLHQGILQTPIKLYESGLEAMKQEGIKLSSINDKRAFLIDFLPIIYRSLRRDGFILDHIVYYNNSLRPFIERRNKNGKFLIYYDSTGRIVSESNYLNGKKNGQFLWFEANGDSLACENYINEVKSGEQREYYPGGKLGKVVHYQNGLLHGAHKTFDKEGKIEIDLNYKEGKNQKICQFNEI